MTNFYSAPGVRPGVRSAPAPKLSAHPAAGRARNYAGAQTNRLNSDWFGPALTADQAIYAAIEKLRSRAQDLERNHDYTRQFLTMVRANVVGPNGFRLNSLVKTKSVAGQPSLATIIERAWKQFGRKEQWSQNHKLGARLFQQLAMVRVIVDGEAIIKKNYGADNKFGLSFQLIDAARLDHTFNRPAGPNINEIRMGVELDSYGRSVAYWLLDAPTAAQYSISAFGERKRVPADQICHLFIPERPSQTRGITYLAPTAMRSRYLDTIETAVQVGYRVAASKMGFLKKTDNYNATEDEDDIVAPQDCAPGEIWELPEGMDFVDWNPDYPGGNFTDLKKSILRGMSAGLGVMYNNLASDYEGVSYSAGMLGNANEKDLWMLLQEFFSESFLTPVFEDWLPLAHLHGHFNLPRGITLDDCLLHSFTGRRWRHMDPVKTNKGHQLALGNITRSPQNCAIENDQDFESVVHDFARARDLLAENELDVPSGWGCAPQPDAAENALVTEPPPET